MVLCFNDSDFNGRLLELVKLSASAHDRVSVCFTYVSAKYMYM